MGTDSEMSQSREQLLRVAADLFGERGYTAVKLQDIAKALGVKQAALYYHVPEGKEKIYVEVMERAFRRHYEGMKRALGEVEPRLPVQLNALAVWLLSEPPLDIVRLARSDLPALSEENSRKLYDLGNTMFMQPIREVFQAAYQRGEIRVVDIEVIATAFLTVIETLHEMHRYKGIPKEVLAQDVIEVLFEGLRRR